MFFDRLIIDFTDFQQLLGLIISHTDIQHAPKPVINYRGKKKNLDQEDQSDLLLNIFNVYIGGGDVAYTFFLLYY